MRRATHAAEPRERPLSEPAHAEAADLAAASHPAETPAPTSVEPQVDTKERLLDAAEQLFAELGFQGASMRAVTQRAGAAVSAANYHFGSKEELLGAVIRRRVEPLNERRLKKLDALESASAVPSVEAVVDAFLRPLFEARAERIAREGMTPEHFRQVAARLYADPRHLVESLRQELFAEVNDRFVAALGRALPEADRAAVDLGMQLMVGMLVHVISGQWSEGEAPPPEAHDVVLRRMVAFAAAGIRAAATDDALTEEALR